MSYRSLLAVKLVSASKAALDSHCVGALQTTGYSTVTDFARLRGWSTSQPRRTAMW